MSYLLIRLMVVNDFMEGSFGFLLLKGNLKLRAWKAFQEHFAHVKLQPRFHPIGPEGEQIGRFKGGKFVFVNGCEGEADFSHGGGLVGFLICED